MPPSSSSGEPSSGLEPFSLIPAMSAEAVRVLIVDDDREDAELVEELLAASTATFEASWVGTYEEGLDAVQDDAVDICLLDYRLGARTGIDFLREQRVRALLVPIVILAGEGSAELDREVMRAGAADYLPKGDLTASLLERAIGQAIERARRLRDEARIRFQADLLNAVGQAVIATDTRGIVTYWNRAAERTYGWSGEEALGRDILELTPIESSTTDVERIMETLRYGGTWNGELEVRGQDGRSFPALVTHAPIRDESGEFIGIVGVSSDISERKSTELALRERVKELRTLHAVGQILNRRDISIGDRLELIVEEMLSATIPSSETGEDGLIEVALTRELPEHDEGPFMTEERELVEHLGLVVGETVARERASQLLSQSLSSLEEGVVILDSVGDERRVRFVNPAAERMFGYPWSEFVGDTPEKAHPSRESFETFGAQAAAALTKVGVFRGTFTLRRKDGSLFQAEQTVSLLDPQRGIAGGVVTAVRDVTQRVQMEDALRDSEERFRQIAEHIDDVFWITPPDKSRMDYVSPAYAKVWGRAPRELYEDPASWTAAIIPEDRARIAEAAQRQPDGRYDETYRIRRPDGEVRWIHDRAFPVTDGEGRVARMVGVAEDVTERRMAEERFRVLGEEMADVIIVTSPEGRVLFASPSVEWITGYSAREFVGTNVLEIVNVDDREAVGGLLEAVAATPEETVRAEFRLLRKDGHFREVESVARNLLHHPAVRGIVVTTRDVSERHVLERRVRQGQKMEAIGRLAGGIAHDFNNILTVIRSETELLLLEHPDTALAEDLEVIRSAADRAATLTSQLLAFSREQILRPRLVELGEVVRNFAPVIERVGGETVNVGFDLRPGLESVQVDPDQLEQVVLNLVVNARDAMPKGGRLLVSTDRDELDEDALAKLPGLAPGRYVALRVADTGTGMSPETTGRIFDPFFTTKPKGKGTGLGLAMAYGFMKQSGGGIHVDTEIGKGSTFHLRFPITGLAVEAPSEKTEPKIDTGVVLLVEADPAVREVTMRVLERGGFTVHAASDATQALEILAAGGVIDLVLTDLSLPGRNGQSVVASALELAPDRPVLIMSGGEGAASDGELSGRVAYLEKPFTRDTLIGAVRSALADGIR